MPALGAAHAGVPDDLLNFQYDSAACAVALGWPVATVTRRRIATRRVGDLLRVEDDPDGRDAGVVTAVAWAHAGSRRSSVPARGGRPDGRADDDAVAIGTRGEPSSPPAPLRSPCRAARG